MKNRQKLYLANFEFIRGEFSVLFSQTLFAASLSKAEKAARKYLRGFYGKGGLSERDGDRYYYLDGEVGVKFDGVTETTPEAVVGHLLIS